MEFDSWLDSFLDAYYRRRPVNATFIGVHDYDDQLPDYSQNGVADTTGEMLGLLNDLEKVDTGSLTPAQELDCKLAEGFLRIQLWEFGSSHFQAGNPSHYMGEAVFGGMSLFFRESEPIGQRLDAAFGRFEQIPAFLDQARANIPDCPAGLDREGDSGV